MAALEEVNAKWKANIGRGSSREESGSEKAATDGAGSINNWTNGAVLEMPMPIEQ